MRPDQRVDQFMRLREVIEERASRKFFEENAQADGSSHVNLHFTTAKPGAQFKIELVSTYRLRKMGIF